MMAKSDARSHDSAMVTVLMQETVTDTVNDGRTRQSFEKGRLYSLPGPLAQQWIGRGWALAARTTEPAEKED
jgi:hypothetical protein